MNLSLNYVFNVSCVITPSEQVCISGISNGHIWFLASLWSLLASEM